MIALYIHFNMTFAVVGSFCICAAILCGVIYFEGPLPGHIFPLGRGHWEGMICQLTFCPAFLFCLLVGGDFARFFPTKQKSVFLDRLCIDQFNQELKQQAILRLGAFIRNSRTMIVLYTDVAAFLTLHNIDHMKVLHLEKTTLLFCNFLAAYVIVLTIVLSLFVFKSIIAVVTPLYIQALAICWAYRKARKRKKITLEKLETFRLEECICSDEGDRPLVYTNIATLMRGIGKVDPKCSQDEALRTFEAMVRKSLPKFIGRQSFELQFGYNQYLLLGFFYGGPVCFDILSGILHDGAEPTLFLIALLVQRNTEWLAFFPMCMMVMELVAHGFLHLEGWREFSYIVSAYTITFVINWGFQTFLRTSVEMAAASTTAFAVHLAASVVFIVSTWRVATWWQAPYKFRSDLRQACNAWEEEQGKGKDPEKQPQQPQQQQQQQQQQQPQQQQPHPPLPPPASSWTRDGLKISENELQEDKVVDEIQRWSV